MAEAGTAYVEFRGDYDQLNRGVSREARRAGTTYASGFGGSLSNGLRSIGGMIAGLTRTAGLALGGLGVAGGAWGLSIAAQGEQAQIAFETMLGSAEKAKSFLEELKAFAAETPFEFPELQTAASSLVSAGVEAEKVIPIMTTLGDVTSGMGTGSEGVRRATVALQQMAAAGRITGEDLNQLRDAGVPVFDLLAAATGKSKEEVAALAQQGKLGRQEMEQLFSALESGRGLERFSGLMEAQSQSLSGLISTLKDTLGQGLADALAPVIPLIKEMIPGITEVASQLTGLFGGLVEALAPRVLPLLETLANLLTGVLGSALDAIEPILGPIAALLEDVAEILGGVLVDAFDALAPIFPVFADAIKEMSPLIRDLVEQLGGELVEALKELVPVMIENADEIMPLTEAMIELLVALLPVIGPLAKLLAQFTKLQAFLAGSVIAPVIRGIAAALGAITSFDFAAAWGAVQRFFSGIPEQVRGALSALPGVLRSMAASGFRAFLAGVRGAIPAILSFVAATPGRVIAALGALAGLLIRAGAAQFRAFLGAVRTGVSTVVSFVRTAPGMIVGALRSLPGLLSRAGASALSAMATAVRGGVSTLVSIARGLPGQFMSGLGSLRSLLIGAGRQLIEGLIEGIKSAAGSVASAIADVVPDWVPGFGGRSGRSGIGGVSLPPITGMAGQIGWPDLAGATTGTVELVTNLNGREVAREIYPDLAVIKKRDRGGR